MPILRGAVTFSRFRVEFPEKAPSDVRRWFSKGLKSQVFEPLDRKSDEDRVAGFVELEDNDATEFATSHLFHGQRALFTWRIDTLKVSAGRVREELLRWEQTFQQENKRKPARGEKAEQRAAIRHQLRTRAQPITKTHDVAWDVDAQRLQIWSGSRKIIDEILAAIEGGFEGVRLIPAAPGAQATAAGIDEDKLKPTAELVGAEGLEVAHGEA